MSIFIKAISLDLDDSLWPNQPVIEKANDVLRKFLLQHVQLDILKNNESFMSFLQQATTQLQHLHHDVSLLRKTIICALLGKEQEDELVEQAFDVYFRARQNVELYADVAEALSWMSERWPLYALTNGNADLSLIGIEDFFVDVITAADVGHAKPHPAMFQELIETTEMQAKQIVHIGDSFQYDVEPALANGLQTVWLRRDGQMDDNVDVLQINELSVLKQHLRSP